LIAAAALIRLVFAGYAIAFFAASTLYYIHITSFRFIDDCISAIASRFAFADISQLRHWLAITLSLPFSLSLAIFLLHCWLIHYYWILR